MFNTILLAMAAASTLVMGVAGAGLGGYAIRYSQVTVSSESAGEFVRFVLNIITFIIGFVIGAAVHIVTLII